MTSKKKKPYGNFLSKKAVLITFASLLLLIPVFLLANAYLTRNSEAKYLPITAAQSHKLRYIENDLVSGYLSDVLGINLRSITRSSSVNVSFSQISLSANRDYYAIASEYKGFAEGAYASLLNTNISFTSSNNISLEPYDTLFSVIGDNLTILTMPNSTNYIQQIAVTAVIDAQNSSACSSPSDDSGSNPSVSVNFIFTGSSCAYTVQLDPAEDNDASGKQFYADTILPNGSIEVKYGRVNGMDGQLAVLTNGITVNISRLELVYSYTDDKVILSSGALTVTSPYAGKQSKVVFAEG